MSEAGRFLYDVAGSGSSSNAADSSFVSALGGDAANTGMFRALDNKIIDIFRRPQF